MRVGSLDVVLSHCCLLSAWGDPTVNFNIARLISGVHYYIEMVSNKVSCLSIEGIVIDHLFGGVYLSVIYQPYNLSKRLLGVGFRVCTK